MVPALVSRAASGEKSQIKRGSVLDNAGRYATTRAAFTDYLLRSQNLWNRTPDLQARFLPDSPEFHEYVDTEAILYFRELQECAVALPPWATMVNVGGETDLRVFLPIGLQCYRAIRNHLRPTPQRSVVLDFGVGCARTARHFYRDMDAFEVHGCDVDQQSIDYLDRNVPLIAAKMSRNLPPLPYPDSMFNAIYSVSVFTHFDRHSFAAWATEMIRCLRPGGRLIVTLHGRTALNIISAPGAAARLNVDEAAFAAARAKFERDGFMWAPQTVTSGDVDSGQFGIAFTDETRLADLFPSALSPRAYSAGEIGGWQDIAVFERVDQPAAPKVKSKKAKSSEAAK